MKTILLLILSSLICSVGFAQVSSLETPPARIYKSAQGPINITSMENAMAGILKRSLGDSAAIYIKSIRWTYDPEAYVQYAATAVNPWMPGTQAEYTIFFTSHQPGGNHQVKCRMLVWDGFKKIAFIDCQSPTAPMWAREGLSLTFAQVGLF